MKEINSKFLSIANEHPDNLAYQQNSILSAKEFAKMLVYQGQFDEALAVSVPALERALELRHAFPPDSKAYIERVGSTSYTVAVAYESVGRNEEADVAFQRHYDCFTKLHAMDPDNELYQTSVLLAAARIDRLADYSVLMRKFLEADPNPDMRYSIACMFAQASQSLKRNPKQLDFVGTPSSFREQTHFLSNWLKMVFIEKATFDTIQTLHHYVARINRQTITLTLVTRAIKY